jgi:hypothetical protein
VKLSHIPLRVAIGAFFLNSGLSKQGLEGQAAEGLHGMAAGALPVVKKIPANPFARCCPAPRSRSAARCWPPSSPPGSAGPR